MSELLRIGINGVVPMHWEMEKASDDAGSLTGWAAVYNVIDRQDDILAPGALRKTIAEWRSSRRVIPLTSMHDNDIQGVIGSLSKAEDLTYGLKTTFRFSAEPEAQQARRKAIEGHLAGLSIFGPVIAKAFTNVGGRPVQIIKEAGLFSVGLAPIPVNADATVLAAKAVSNTPWSQFTQADYTPEQWRRACLIDTGQGDVDSKDRYSLPVREPSGTLNRNGVHAAAGRLNQVQTSAEKKATAARALIRLYGELGEDPPDSLRRMAGQAAGKALPDQWVGDMKAALNISAPMARKAAVDSLVADRYGAGPDPAAADDTSADEASIEAGQDTTDDAGSDAAQYALSIIGESGPSGDSPGGEPSTDSLVDQLMASIDAETNREDLRALAAGIETLKGE
jgi:HK97 family phage prohead protease